MATADQIDQVRQNTNETDEASPWTDGAIDALIDSLGSVDLASGAIWRRKVAEYAELVDTSEAGASRKLSDLYDRAVKQAAYWEGQPSVPSTETSVGRAKVKAIVRSTL
jgi:hypothetical protein